MKKVNKILAIFGAGLVEQMLYTLYLLAVGRYMIIPSTLLMFTYMVIYLLIINYAIKDEKNTIPLLIVYALSSGVGNYLAMSLKIIK
jgi:hypothetical protein